MIVHGDVVLVSLKHVVLVSLKLTQSMSNRRTVYKKKTP